MRAHAKVITAVAIVMGLSTAPILAETAVAKERYRVLVCKKTKGKQGTVIGGLTGGTLGAAVAGNGAKTEGAILGGVVGAVAGNQIAKKKKCHYEYRYR